MSDTSEKARKIKDVFRSRLANTIVGVLNPYRKSDCRQGRINNNEDFKYLARKVSYDDYLFSHVDSIFDKFLDEYSRYLYYYKCAVLF